MSQQINHFENEENKYLEPNFHEVNVCYVLHRVDIKEVHCTFFYFFQLIFKKVSSTYNFNISFTTF